jgi:hypothetical protein
VRGFSNNAITFSFHKMSRVLYCTVGLKVSSTAPVIWFCLFGQMIITSSFNIFFKLINNSKLVTQIRNLFDFGVVYL